MAALHPKLRQLRARREGRSGDTQVFWKELDLIIDLLEDLMEGTDATEAELTQFESDEAARDAATTQALTDLKAEVEAKEAEHPEVDMTAINSRITALDTAVKGGTAEAQAADPGAPTTSSPSAPAPAPNKPVYTFDPAAEGATEDPRFSNSNFQITGGGAGVFYFSEDSAGTVTATNANPAPGYTAYTGSVEAVPAATA